MTDRSDTSVTDRAYFYGELDRLGLRAFFEQRLRVDFFTTLEDVAGAGKEKHVASARRWMMAQFTERGWSDNAIAKLFGRTRATVAYGRARDEARKPDPAA